MKTYLRRPYAVVSHHWQTGEDLQEIVDWLNMADITWHGHIDDPEVGSTTVHTGNERWLQVRDKVDSLCYDFSDEELDKGHWFVAQQNGIGAGGDVIWEFDQLTDEQFKKKFEYENHEITPRTEQPCG